MPKNSKPSCLNDYRPVALTSIVMKVFERLVKSHISSSIPVTLDPLQFTYRSNRSTDDAISHILHSSLTHIDSSNGNYARLLFIDYSSAFNTIVPTKPAVKLSDLGLNTSLCNWIQDFLTGRPQVVKVGQFTSNSITLNVGAPQGCVLSPLLYSLYTHDCVSSHRSTSRGAATDSGPPGQHIHSGPPAFRGGYIWQKSRLRSRASLFFPFSQIRLYCFSY